MLQRCAPVTSISSCLSSPSTGNSELNPDPLIFFHKPVFFFFFPRSPGDGAEWKTLVLYSCLQNSSHFDSAQSEVSAGNGHSRIHACNSRGGGCGWGGGCNRQRRAGAMGFLRLADTTGNAPGETMPGLRQVAQAEKSSSSLSRRWW